MTANQIAMISVISSIVTPVVVLIATLKHTNKINKKQERNFYIQLDLQKKQWANDTSMKKEMEILLEFRELLFECQNSFHWFNQVLKPLKYGNFTPKEEQRTFKYKDGVEYSKKLQKLNNLYNGYQFIFIKNGFSEYIEFIIVYLEVWRTIYDEAKGKDLISHFVGNEGETEAYELDIFPTIIRTFSFYIFNLLNKNELPNPQEYLEKYDEYIEIVNIKCTELNFLLDEKLFYFDGKVPDDLKSRSMRFYQDELFM